MARMLPAEPRSAVASELDMFRAIRDGLGDEWTAIHSFGMTAHPRKPWTEIDFVLIGPPGLFCIEVKGGVEIRRQGNVWTYVDNSGRKVVRHESPFEQVGGASAALRTYLTDRDGRYHSVLSGYGVAAPFVDFDIQGADLLPEVVYDARDVPHPFADYADRLVAHWRSSIGRNDETLSPQDRERLVKLLAGDFKLTRGLSGKVEDVQRSLIRLTEEQTRVVAGIQNERLLVRGGAGTGKTLLALQMAVESASAGSRTMLTCFNRRLGEWLEGQTSDIDGLTIVSFHRYMRDLLARTDRIDSLPPADSDHLMKVEFPNQAMEAMLELEITGSVDRLIVDEAQDLLIPSYVDVFDQLLNGGIKAGSWALFYDPNQNLFESIAGDGMERIREANPAIYGLTTNCRNTQQISYEAALLAGTDPPQTLGADGPDVEEIWVRDAADERRKVSRAMNRLLSQGIRPDQIVVLSPRSMERSCLAQGFEDVPYELTSSPTPTERQIGYSTVQSFKGLESDVIVAVDVEGLEDSSHRYLIYVAATRARAHLVVALSEPLHDQYQAAAGQFGERIAKAMGRRG